MSNKCDNSCQDEYEKMNYKFNQEMNWIKSQIQNTESLQGILERADLIANAELFDKAQEASHYNWLDHQNEKLEEQNQQLQNANTQLIEGINKVIEMNLTEALHRYGDKSKAETWGCVIELRKALKQAGVS